MTPVSTDSSTLAHERAYNLMKPAQERLNHLTSLAEEERQRPDIEKKIDQAEVELEKRNAQLEATSRMLKQRAKTFLNKYTPKVLATIKAFTVCKHQVLASMSDTIAGGVKKKNRIYLHYLNKSGYKKGCVYTYFQL